MKILNELYPTNRRGASPVTAVILLVAISVGLSAFLGFVVFNISGDKVSDPAQSAIDTSLNDGVIEVSVIRNSNVDRVFVRDVEDTIVKSINLSGGQAGVFQSVPTGGGNYEVVGVVDGNKQVIKNYEVAAVRIDMTLGGSITDDALFNIKHEGGDNISAENMQIWIDAEDTCGKSTRFINLPVDGGDPRPEGSFTLGAPIIDNEFNSVSGTINNETDNKYSKGDSFGFSVAQSDCEMNPGDKLNVSVVDISERQPVIVGRGNYSVESTS